MSVVPRPRLAAFAGDTAWTAGEPSISLRHEGAAAVVALGGEHDLATRDALREALAPLSGDVVVDLAACTFIDASVLGVLIAKRAELAGAACRLHVRVPASNSGIVRTLSLPCVREQLGDVASGGPSQLR